MNRATNAYFQTQTVTSSQGEMLLMLYEGAIKFLNRAKEKIGERDFAAKGIAISKAIAIISELDASLNAEKGGELAGNLHRLYGFCNSRLLDANLKMHIPFIDEVISILEGLRSAYAAIINTPEAQSAAKMAPKMASTTRMPTRPTQTSVFGRPAAGPGGMPQPARTHGFTAYQRDAAPAQPAPAAATAPEAAVAVGAQAAPAAQPAAAPEPAARPGGFGRSLSGSSLYQKMARQI